MMHRLTDRDWFIPVLLFGLAVVTLELDRVIPIPETMHHLDLALAIILMLVAGAAYICQHAQKNRDENVWWDDDDWTHWGGI
jgi:hypothetical protein